MGVEGCQAVFVCADLEFHATSNIKFMTGPFTSAPPQGWGWKRRHFG